MTRSEKASAYLENCRFAGKEIRCLKETLVREHRMADYYSKILNTNIRKRPNFIAFIESLERRLADQENELRELCILLDSVSDDKSQEILKLFYIDGMTAEDIADKLFYSINTIFRIKAKGINDVAALCDFQDD